MDRSRVDLEGQVVSSDAMRWRTETEKTIVTMDADSILTVKGNQRVLQEALNAMLLNAMDREDPKLRRCGSGERRVGDRNT